jgi:hypothetical protein
LEAQVKRIEEVVYPYVLTGLLTIDSEGRIWRSGFRAENRTTLGYLQVRLMLGAKRYHALAHRLVYRHVSGQPIPDGLTINHRNGKKDDNRPGNLELASYSQQAVHARRVLGRGRLDQSGERNAMAKLTAAGIATIRSRRAGGERLKTIARDFGVSDRTISRIALGHRWISS